MPEIESEVTFTIPAAMTTLYLQPEGVTLVLNKLNIDQAQIASLSWLVSGAVSEDLNIQIKVNP